MSDFGGDGSVQEELPVTSSSRMEDIGFRQEIQMAINKYSKENGSNTPDFILARYLTDCLTAFDKATASRSSFYGHHSSPGNP